MKIPEPGYLSLTELAKHSGRSRRQLQYDLSQPVDPLPHHQDRPGGKIRVRVCDFEQWAAQRRRVGIDLDEKIRRNLERQRRQKARKPESWRFSIVDSSRVLAAARQSG